MLKTVGKAIKLNLDDLGIAAAILGGVFLLLELVISIVLLTVGRSADSTIAVGWAILPCVGAFVCLFFNTLQAPILFDLQLRFGLTRKSTLLSTVSLMLIDSCASVLFGWLLGELDRLIAHGWVRLLPNLTWVENADAHFPWIVLLLLPLGVTVLGLGAGALLQRFGIRGFWILWGAWMAFIIGQSFIPWDGIIETVTASPVLSALAFGGVALVIVALSVCSLMRATVRN